jgi:hypothetical protein
MFEHFRADNKIEVIVWKGKVLDNRALDTYPGIGGGSPRELQIPLVDIYPPNLRDEVKLGEHMKIEPPAAPDVQHARRAALNKGVNDESRPRSKCGIDFSR